MHSLDQCQAASVAVDSYDAYERTWRLSTEGIGASVGNVECGYLMAESRARTLPPGGHISRIHMVVLKGQCCRFFFEMC